jgi:protoporphyrinogen oxidase
VAGTFVIVGAGLAGLFAARTLYHFGIRDIHIIEKSNNVGGLLQSTVASNPLGDGVDYSFDIGTHFVLSTAQPEIDNVILQDVKEEDYCEFHNSLQEGHYINGKLSDRSGCIDIAHFSETLQSEIRSQIGKLVENNKDESHDFLYDACVEKYGVIATESILEPIFEKLTGQSSKKLSSKMEGTLFPSRLIIEDRARSKVLKRSPEWDMRIAFADCSDSTSDILKRYPKQGGIGQWVGGMAENLVEDGIEIHTGRTADSVTGVSGKIESIALSNGSSIDCCHLIWTLPPIFLAIAAKVDVPSVKPSMRRVGIVNFLIDQRPIKRPYWITVCDPHLRAFRVTLYDNFSEVEAKTETYRVTVEVLHDGSFEGSREDQDTILAELRTMGIVPQHSKALWSEAANVSEGFPILTPAILETTLKQIEILEGDFKNVSIVGRRPDRGHGQISVLTDIYESIKQLSFI